MDEATRLDLWEAFSEYFLDTELSEASFRHIARVVKQSGVALPEAEAVLWNEVFPTLRWNLLAVVGVWDGWSREWLKANLRPSTGPARSRRPRFLAREIQRCWDRTLEHLNSQA